MTKTLENLLGYDFDQELRNFVNEFRNSTRNLNTPNYNWPTNNWNDQLKNGNTTSAPLRSQVFEWFRKNHSIHSIVSYYGKGQWNIEILDYKGNELIQIEDNTFWSYEEAESACIDKLIEILQHGR